MPTIRSVIERVLELDPSALGMADSDFTGAFYQVAISEFGVNDPQSRWQQWSILRERFRTKSSPSAATRMLAFRVACSRYKSGIEAVADAPGLWDLSAKSLTEQFDDAAESLSPEVHEDLIELDHALTELQRSRTLGALSPEQESEFDSAIGRVMEARSRALLEAQTAYENSKIVAQFVREKLDTSRTVILPATFVYLMALLDSFIAEVLAYHLSMYPDQLGQSNKDRSIPYSTVFGASSYQDVVRHIVEKEVRRITNERMSVQLEELRKRGVDMSGIDLMALEELAASRNVYVHNGGRVNGDYRELSKAYWRSRRRRQPKLGEIRPLNLHYMGEAKRQALSLVAGVETKFFGVGVSGTEQGGVPETPVPFL